MPPGNRLEPLKGKWKGYHSIRINDQWRVVFHWMAGNASEELGVPERRGLYTFEAGWRCR